MGVAYPRADMQIDVDGELNYAIETSSTMRVRELDDFRRNGLRRLLALAAETEPRGHLRPHRSSLSW